LKTADIFATINLPPCTVYISHSFITEAIIVNSSAIIKKQFQYKDESIFCFDLDTFIQNLKAPVLSNLENISENPTKTLLICNVNNVSISKPITTHNFAIMSNYKPNIVNNFTNTFKSFHGTPAITLSKYGILGCFFEEKRPCFKLNVQNLLQSSYPEIFTK
jgi:hypothetical protein